MFLMRKMDTNNFKYKFALWKCYFETGYSFLSYPKYILFLMGLGNVMATGGNYNNVVLIGIIIGILCFVVGWGWFRYDMAEAQIEVNNQYNPFVREMRELSGSVVSKKI